MSLNVPLKIRNPQGDLQLFTTAEENYLAYQMALKLADATTSSPASISLDSTNATLIGSFNNTFYNEPVGTSEATGLTIGSITTQLYQKNGLGDSASADYRILVGYGVGDNSIREMADSDLDTFLDRMLSKAFIGDYPGSYKLDSAAWSGSGWVTHISNVFTDTQTDGTTKNYHIFKRQTMSAPTVVLPMAVRRSSGKSGTYLGLQQLTAAQIKEGLGQQAISRISAGDIGEYRLRSSAEGAPSPGTWVAKGVAIDTRKTVGVVNYTKDYGNEYTTQYTGVYAKQYTGDYSRQYTKDYVRQYTTQFTGSYGGLVDKS